MTSVFTKGPGLTTQENTVLSFTMDRINQKQRKHKAFYFLNIPAYLSLLISLKG